MRFNLSLKYVLFTAVILLAALGITLGITSKRHEQLVMAQVEMQAKVLFRQVIITRRWIAEHGGLYVEKAPWAQPNPYLKDSVIMDRSGKKYLKENPAMVMKQLSLYAQNEGLYFFHITSLKLINPENAPDEFEAQALRDFETKKVPEVSGVQRMGDSYFYRYMAPVYIEKACLQCHGYQGYAVGDIRGGISIGMPMDYVASMLKTGRKYMVAGGIAMAIALMLALFLMTRHMVITPINRIRSFMARFSRGGDPEMPLLRTGDEIEDLSRSFNDMAKAVHDYQNCLQEKVRAATSELSQQNRNLIQKSRAKSDFLAKVSHELRTPLTSIKGAMDYLSVKLAPQLKKDEEDMIVFFDVIKKNAERLIRLVNNVLDYERIELGGFEMNFKEVNLKMVFQEAVTEFKPLSREKNVDIRLVAEDVTATVDEDRIKQVVDNLLSNALHFSPEGSSIIVSLSEEDGRVHAAVEDDGAGIPEGERGKIFQQFYTTRLKDGTGLGLAICRGIIEAHNGEIGVREAGTLQGSCFWITIPKHRKGAAVEEQATACR
jgi:signal transduction histidine kinase